MELCRHTGDIGIARACVECKFSRRGVRNGIPVNFRFVFAVRRVPHDFCGISGDVTDGDVCDTGFFDKGKRGKRKRSLRTVYEIFGLCICGVVGVCSSDIEVVSCTRL